MRLIDRLTQDGGWLFRWRSFLPRLLLPPMLAALPDAAAMDARMGESAEDVWAALCLLVSFAGLAMRWATVGFVPAGTSGRNTEGQRANALNTTGMYSIVRNPLYLGNFAALLGVVLMLKAWWLVAILGLGYWLYIERIVAAEEAYLATKFGPAYAQWVAVTPAFVPRPRRWRRPALGFSLRTVLRREYNGVLAVAAGFVAVEMLTDIVEEGMSPLSWARADFWWLELLFGAVVVFVTLRTLKKHTRLLSVAGR